MSTKALIVLIVSIFVFLAGTDSTKAGGHNACTDPTPTAYDSCEKARDFGAFEGTRGLVPMCGDDQYYKASVPSGKKCTIRWRVAPDVTADYDLRANKPPKSCPAGFVADCASMTDGNAIEECEFENAEPGIYTAWVYYAGGGTTGNYAITVTIEKCTDLFPLPTVTGVLAILENIGNWIFIIGLLIAVVMVILGAYMFIDPFSGGAGNPAQVEKGRSIFLWAAVGLAVILLAKGIFTVLRSIFGV